MNKGKWILERTPDGKPYCLHCSICDYDFKRISVKLASPFCPYCGKEMDVKKLYEWDQFNNGDYK